MITRSDATTNAVRFTGLDTAFDAEVPPPRLPDLAPPVERPDRQLWVRSQDALELADHGLGPELRQVQRASNSRRRCLEQGHGGGERLA